MREVKLLAAHRQQTDNSQCTTTAQPLHCWGEGVLPGLHELTVHGYHQVRKIHAKSNRVNSLVLQDGTHAWVSLNPVWLLMCPLLLHLPVVEVHGLLADPVLVLKDE